MLPLSEATGGRRGSSGPRPLSDAETTFMPELHPRTVPIRVAYYCARCNIKLTAVPEDPIEHEGRKYHPTCYRLL